MAAKMKPCNCRSWDFGNYGPDGSAESYESYGTDCNQSTTRVFAQGHDAKLVGFMVRAELAGQEIALVDGGIRTTFPGAVAAAASISEALAVKAQAQIDAAKARLAKKAATEARRVARQSAKAVKAIEAPVVEVVPPTTRQAEIKVGRWTYLATIQANGDASYSSKLGVKKTAVAGSYQEI